MSLNQKTDWFAYNRPNISSRIRLFCFPYAGGGASIYCRWMSLLPASIHVVPVQLPGRENRINSPALSCIDSLVHELVDPFSNLMDMPFAFFGHSMGALIAFELARKLRTESLQSPSYLFVSGRHAPNVPGILPPISHLSDTDFLKQLKSYNGTPMEVMNNQELMEIVLPTLRADFKLGECYNYLPTQPLDCPISAFCGMEDPLIHFEDVEKWKEESTGPFIMRKLPGNHFFLKNECAALAGYIADDLNVDI